MTFRSYSDGIVGAISTTVNALVVGNYSMGTTDPNMRFMPQLAIWETIALTGTATGTATISAGITSSNYDDILQQDSNANLETLNGVARAGLASVTDPLTIAPGSTVYCRVSTAATGATVLTVRLVIIGIYY